MRIDEKPYQLILGDCLAVMKTLADNSVDSIVTDCPYELGFMGKKWDATGVSYNPEVWREALRLLKPGGHLLAFGGTRTYHRIAVAIEDAGFDIRDQIQWIYGSGFPKSLSVSKAIDKMQGAEREILAVSDASRPNHQKGNAGMQRLLNNNNPHTDILITAPATDEAKQWDGWGTALKPANEPICLARKPLEKGLTVAQNVLKWGTGSLAIDRCRVGSPNGITSGGKPTGKNNPCFMSKVTDPRIERTPPHSLGRFPANVIHDGSDEVEAEFAKYGEKTNGHWSYKQAENGGLYELGLKNLEDAGTDKTKGTASRFFYCAKASKSERGENNNHPCVKPVSLMKYLCRLITPPNGIILDMFCGSGSTGKAAIAENFKFIGIDQDADYLKIAEARIEAALNKQPLLANAA